jgi:uncharacterized membrane protein HdeD (DUF308 family)
MVLVAPFFGVILVTFILGIALLIIGILIIVAGISGRQKGNDTIIGL